MSEATPHYLLITVGTAGDVRPFMHTARAFQAMGRKVALITHSYHATLVEGAGLPFVALGKDEDYLNLMANPDLWDPKKAFSAFMANDREQIEQIEQAIGAPPPHASDAGRNCPSIRCAGGSYLSGTRPHPIGRRRVPRAIQPSNLL